jgi:hypothetical protein
MSDDHCTCSVPDHTPCGPMHDSGPICGHISETVYNDMLMYGMVVERLSVDSNGSLVRERVDPHDMYRSLQKPSRWNWWLRTIFGCSCIFGVVALAMWWFP